ncbi:MAG TPA: arginine--tRNA ligase, partial [Abditibacteriaceae bacterium]|nr:arginine--tRNA ligase [Abditibacteriaceae bacterium]
MQTVQQQLQSRIDAALQIVLRDADTSSVARDALQVVPCANPQFGDYQFNGALPLAKLLKTNPRALAPNIVAHLDVAAISETPEIAGPGFINFRLKREFIEGMTAAGLTDPRLGVPFVAEARTVIVDYPSPNVAKPLHVGHIRTTFIGDAIARLLRFAGHHVIGDNHVGDWGTGFGKVIIGWKKYRDEDNFKRQPMEEMGRLYKIVHAACESDPAVEEEAREETAKLQTGNPENRAIWERLRAASQAEIDRLYERLD